MFRQRLPFLAALAAAGVLAGQPAESRAQVGTAMQHSARPSVSSAPIVRPPAAVTATPTSPGYASGAQGSLALPIFMSTLNTPGIYGAYDYGIASLTLYNREPQFFPAYPQRAVIPALTTTAAAVSPSSDAALATQTQLTDTASIRVLVPADAEVIFQGQAMPARGTERTFVTPPLTVGTRYRYDVEASWRQADQDMHQNRRVYVRAGDRLTLDFTPEGPTLQARPTLPAPAARE